MGAGEPARSRLLSGQRWHARSVSVLIANCPVDVAQKLLATRKAGESFLAVFLVFCSSGRGDCEGRQLNRYAAANSTRSYCNRRHLRVRRSGCAPIFDQPLFCIPANQICVELQGKPLGAGGIQNGAPITRCSTRRTPKNVSKRARGVWGGVP